LADEQGFLIEPDRITGRRDLLVPVESPREVGMSITEKDV
jgi:hypothetical protein